METREVMKMLIGFSGASCSGKTTTVKRVAEMLENKGYNVGIVTEVARDIFPKYGYKTLKELRNSEKIVDFQREVIETQIKSEKKMMERYEIVLTDRTTYDNLMFSIPIMYMYPDRMNEITEAFKPNTYDIIFLLEPLPPKDDGFRTPDTNYQQFQHLILTQLLPKYYFVPATNLTIRALECYKVIINQMCPLHKAACDWCLFYDPHKHTCTFPKDKYP